MSTLSGVTQKGEKGKSKFQSLDINNLYHQTNRGESSEPHQTKNTAPRRHGMQPLGKVPSTRRPPANLPSLKSEHSGNDPSVSLVPSGGTGWGSKPGETGPSPASQPTSQSSSTPTTATSAPQTHGSSAPAAAGIGMPAASTNIPPPTQAAQPPPMMKPIVGSSGDKTWSSVTGGDSGPSFLAHQSPQFQQEFPSLSGEGAGQGPPGGGGGGGGGKGSGGSADAQYGPGPSLRPQTEGSWIGGGSQLRPGQIAPPSHPPQHPYLPQEMVGGSQSGGGSRGSSALFGVAAGPGGLSSTGGPPPSAPPVPATFRNVMPNFLQKSAGFSAFPPPTTTSSSSNFQNNIRPPRFNPNFPDINRYNSSSRHADPEDLTPRPIIRKEDLTRMDEISRDAGWATQNDIDYDQQIAFSDEESAGVDDDKESNKEKSKEPDKREDSRREIESDKESKDIGKPNDRLNSNEKQLWGNRGPSTGSVEFRQYSRPSHTMVSENEEDHWSEKRRQTSENIKQVTEKAKQRKEEEEKKFEESRSKTIADNDKLKVKKDEDSRHSSASPITDWDHGEGKGGMMSHPPPPNKDSMNESGGTNFRQMTQIESRNDNMRDRFRGDRMDGGRGFNPPRFQKQMQQHSNRGPPNSNSYDGGQNRWSNSNSHGPMSNFPVKSGGGMRRGPDMGGDLENERFLHKEDKVRMHNDERERYRPNARNDGAHDSNRKSNYYEGSFDYNRPHHRDFEHNNRERIKDSDYRQRDRDEVEWEGRRGNNNSWDPKQFDDKSHGRKDRKPNDNFHKSQSTPFGDDREMDRPQRPESRDRPERPARPDSRDSRASRESRNSRDSMREDNNRSIPESNDYSWGLSDYDKDSKDDKLRKKDLSKEEKREVVSRREGHVPGPITKEKMFAYDLKHKQLSKTDKKEIIGTALINSVPEEDTRNKLAPMGTSVQLNSLDDGWSEQDGGPQGLLTKEGSPLPLTSMPISDDADKSGPLKDDFDKKKDGALKDKDGKNVRGGRGPRNSRQGGERPFNSSSSNFFFSNRSGGPTNYPRDNNRRRGPGKGGLKDKGPLGSDSDASLDEVSASTESGKEDKKSDRRQLPRSSRSGERKKDKDDRNNRETKKIENEKNSGSRKHGSGGLSGGGGGYEMNRREGFAPRGEPSRRGRGGYRPGGRGALSNVGGHYGPPGSKSPFPQANQSHHLDIKDDEDGSRTGNEKPLDSDHLSSDADKSKPSNKQHQGNITGGNRTPRESRKNDGVKGKVRSKAGSGEDRDSTSDGGSDSDMKKQPRNLQKMDKNKSNQRTAGEKRAPYNSTAHMNGRPSRSDEGKDNGFQEVKGKKVGKESRPLSRGRKEGKGKGSGPLGSGNGSGPQQKNNPSSKTFQREWSNNNKPPRLQKLENVRKQQMAQQQDVTEMNKINQNALPLFSSTIRDVNCSMTPAPPPTKSAWEKPITAALRASSPTNTLHLASSISNPSEKTGMEIPDHVHSGTSSQTSSPSAEKAMSSKLGREVDKGMLDGATPPVQTIIFENTNYKTPELAMKSKYSLKPNQRIDKGRGKLDDDLDGATHGIGGLSFKTGVDLKSCDNKTQESLQMPMTFKNEDNADMKLDFPFDSDLSQLTEDKTNIPRSSYLGQSSAELNQKIASVKKVWDTASSAMEHQHHGDEGHVVSTSSSSFPPNFGGAVDSALDHATSHQVDDNTFNNADVYSPGMQGAGGSYSSSAAGMMKPDPTNPSGGIKPQPQQAAVMSTSIGTHSSQSLSSPPPPFNPTGHFSYQAQYGGIPTIPSPPAVLVNPQGAQVPANSQDYVQQHPFPFNSPMIGNQTPRSNYSQQPAYPYSLTQNLTQSSFSQPQSAVYIPTQPAANPTPPELFSATYRLQASYGQSAQINNNPSAVLITSSTSNSLMSASVKSTPQQPPPPLGAIGTKAGYQNSQIQMGFMSYEPHSIIPNYAPLVTQRHAGGNPPAMTPSTSFYSGSTVSGGPGAFSSLLGTNNQSMHSATTAFSMQSFSNQSAGNPGGAPQSSNVGHPSFGAMGHFRTTYIKPGQHQPDASKSPSANQEVLSNSVFSASSGGGQIPSPKSRTAGGANSSSSGKQVSVSPQQPSPTQTHHKFSSYPQQNLVGQQPPPNSQPGSQRSGSQLGGGVRTNNGNGGGGLNNSVHMKYAPGPPGPIQRPGPASYQSTQHQQALQFHALAAHQAQQQQQHQQQQRHRVQAQQPSSRPPQQPHVKNNYAFIQQANPVKLETGMEGKGDQDKFLDASSNPSKPDKKDEVAGVSDQ